MGLAGAYKAFGDERYKTVAGSVVVPVDLINIGYWLQMLLGDPTTTGADPYTHVYFRMFINQF